jgi:thiol-disulfide isomerase/thioredoxin
MIRGLFLCAIALFLNCCSAPKTKWHQLVLKDLTNNEIALSQFKNGTSVFIFLSPECPLCRNYSLRINELQKEFENDTLNFIGVVAGNFYSKQEIKEYLVKHRMRLTVLLDTDFKLTKALEATITPEVFVFTSGGAIAYCGAIDNWVIGLGQKRLETSEHFLHNALISLQQKTPVNPTKTKAIGCFIE